MMMTGQKDRRELESKREAKTSTFSYGSQTRSSEELQMGEKSEGQKLRETALAKDQTDRLPMADEMFFMPFSGALCVFCDILHSSKPKARIRLETPEIIIIDDHRPRAEFHFQCIPRRHIKNITCLTLEDRPLLLDMGSRAREFLDSARLEVSEFEVGFHRPPYNSVRHLHLHIIGPRDTITEKYMFREPIFASVESVLTELLSVKENRFISRRKK
ncbi:hypothetical protein FGIG_07229 [Fasciola gigantica]|uniref:Adenosine 5'-monophosphoramidase HINT3 n=1 Tax=Fasciola gigantica TaxID=46835 RepID=A0A504YE25_FASGI|nr:hypothetical protein FGIG_07229 [Fasciola gigantica]